MNSLPAQNTERDTVGHGDSISRGFPSTRRRNPAACLHCRKRKIRCNVGEVDVCDKCHAQKKPCVVLSVTCEDVIRSHNYDPEIMPSEELRSVIQVLVQTGELNHSDAPYILSNHQTSNQPASMCPTPCLSSTHPSHSTQPNYDIIQPNSTPSQHMPGYSIPHVNQPPHVPNAYSAVIPSHGDPRTTESLGALYVPGVNHYHGAPASFPSATMRHGSYAVYPGQGSLPFLNPDQIGQANHLPYSDQTPRGYPASDKAGQPV